MRSKERWRLIPIAVLCAVAGGLPLKATTVNLITNPSFEGGSTDGWNAGWSSYDATCAGLSVTTGSAACGSAGAPVFGSNALYASAALLPADGNYNADLFQQLTVPEGVTSATFTWWQEGQWDLEGGAGLLVQAQAGSNSSYWADRVEFSSIQSGSQDWTQYSWDVTSVLTANAGQTILVGLDIELGDFDFDTADVSATLGLDNFALIVTTNDSGAGAAAGAGTWLPMAAAAGAIAAANEKRKK